MTSLLPDLAQKKRRKTPTVSALELQLAKRTWIQLLVFRFWSFSLAFTVDLVWSLFCFVWFALIDFNFAVSPICVCSVHFCGVWEVKKCSVLPWQLRNNCCKKLLRKSVLGRIFQRGFKLPFLLKKNGTEG